MSSKPFVWRPPRIEPAPPRCIVCHQPIVGEVGGVVTAAGWQAHMLCALARGASCLSPQVPPGPPSSPKDVMTLSEASRLHRELARQRAEEPVRCFECRAKIPKRRVVRARKDGRLLGYSCGRCGFRKGLTRGA